ncbi:MAG: hypothetical protein QUS11_02680 [Candidatus Fermentibacter sp.]|nr:hypothetical protein [Candidatus Fermentibacter sp.]
MSYAMPTGLVFLIVMLLRCATGSLVAPSMGAAPVSGSTFMVVAEDSLAVRARPDAADGRWGVLALGESVEIGVTTRDGWLGFDPGVAQAGNSGSFRYRWIEPGWSYTTVGDPSMLEVVWGPSAGIRYAMTFEPVDIHSEPDPLSAVLGTLPGGSAAAIVSQEGDWLRIDPSEGPAPDSPAGWISLTEASISEP